MLTHFVGTSYSSALATRPKKRIMSMIYKHGQRYGLISRSQESNPTRFVRCKTTSGYEAMILTPEQAYAVLLQLQGEIRPYLVICVPMFVSRTPSRFTLFDIRMKSSLTSMAEWLYPGSSPVAI